MFASASYKETCASLKQSTQAGDLTFNLPLCNQSHSKAVSILTLLVLTSLGNID